MKEKALEKYKELKAEKPNLDTEMIHTFIEDMPFVALATLDKIEYGKHIISEELAEKGISYIKNKKGEYIGAKWSIDEIMNVAKGYVNIDEKNFYPLDLYVWVNIKFGDYGHRKCNANDFIQDAIDDLTDDDFPFYPADERAYCWVMEHLKKDE